VKVSLIIPVYNESGHLQDFLTQLDQLDLGITKELIIVNDHSNDGSDSIIDKFAFTSDVKILHQPQNKGKGAAIHAGIDLASGDYIGVQDADFEYCMTDIKTLLQPLIENKADVVFGSRFKKSGAQVHRTFHYIVNRMLTLLSNICSGLYLTDMETCYKFFRRDIIKNINLQSGRFGFEPEITAKIAKLNMRIFELPISYFPRNYLQGKKITWKDGIAAVHHILFFNFSVKPSEFLKSTLPERYIPKDGNWL
jgi:glycosyltransferase involved in cell wall biosynthesis